MEDKDWRPDHEPIAVLQLGTPIDAYGEKLAELPFWRRPTAADLEALEEANLGTNAGSIFLMHRLTNVPRASLRKLDGFDFRRADAIVDHFLRRGPSVPIATSRLRLSPDSSPA